MRLIAPCKHYTPLIFKDFFIGYLMPVADNTIQIINERCPRQLSFTLHLCRERQSKSISRHLMSAKHVIPEVFQGTADHALRQRFGSRFATLDKTAVQAVVTAQLEGSVTNSRMQEITGEHAKDITSVLQSLVRDGLLTQQNQRRWASYRVAEDSPQSVDDSPYSAGNSPQSAPQWAGDSPHSAANSPHLSQELLSLAEPARHKTRLPAAEMQALVMRLCDARWLTSKDLAALLNCDAENLQSRTLGGMVKKGLLELRSPDVPNRPDQAYRTVANGPARGG